MTVEPGPARPIAARPWLVVGLAGLAVAQVVLLATTLAEGPGPVPPDIVLFRAAADAVRAGQAAAFYDPSFAKGLEAAAAGRDFEGAYRWVYPPTAYLAVLPLAGLPLGLAQALAMAATFAAFAAVLAAIAGSAGLVLALAWPASLACGLVGQNGFLTAAILGGGLLLLRRWPVMAGVVLGLLTAKPHLGLLVPIALLAARDWRAFAGAAASALGTALLSVALLGPEPWLAFLGSLRGTGDGLLGDGVMGFGKLQTAYGFARWFGLPISAAGAAQTASALLGAALVWRAWRRPNAPPSVKGAALAAAICLATPYLYVYDLTVAALSVAVLLRLGPSRVDVAGVALAALLVFIHVATGIPAGFGSVLIVYALVARRVLANMRG